MSLIISKWLFFLVLLKASFSGFLFYPHLLFLCIAKDAGCSVGGLLQ